ncbi:hypothetical protein GCM10023231_11320 [Olivibacter ginsenosidimutans]|uniref:Prevent-host-death protein n=1 Tax=Olivibacter ginsenosidimutans TaxID=1176537 RepID=A0ABP9ASA9_9SPHI
MKTLSVGEFKTHFSDVIDDVKKGAKIAVTYGKKKQIVGYFIPALTDQPAKRPLGLLAGKAEVIFKDDFEMSEEEFLG